MTLKFGIEIEFNGANDLDATRLLAGAGFACVNHGYTHRTMDSWKVVPDGSLSSNSAELVSPPLMFGADSLATVERAYSALNAIGMSASAECGTHVHVDATWLNAYTPAMQRAFFAFVTAAFQANESNFDMMVKSHRATNNRWCKSTLGKTARDLQGDRYHKLNLNAFNRHGTIEFRQLQGTLNATTAKAWITLCVAFVANCRKRFEAVNGIAASAVAV